jgi:hypothetical protein
MLLMSSKKKPVGRPLGRTPKYSVHTGIEMDIGLAFEQWLKDQEFDVKLKDVVEKMFTQFLAERGYWPPPKKS